MRSSLRLFVLGLMSLCVYFIGTVIGNYYTQSNQSHGDAHIAALFPVYYQSLGQLAAESDLVVSVRVDSEGQSFWLKDDFLSTLTTVEVEKVHSGKWPGPKLKVLEEGGTIDGKTINPVGERTKKGQRCLLFLKRPLTSDFDNDTFVVTGSFMGKFEVDTNGKLRLMGPSDEIKGLAEEIASMNIEDLPQKLDAR